LKPISYLRIKDGKPDWAEDCVSEDESSLLSTLPGKRGEEGYDVIALYAIPKGWTLVPNDATDAMLRPFMGCPDDELQLAWNAALRITLATIPVIDA
jgi:hypothetical protein